MCAQRARRAKAAPPSCAVHRLRAQGARDGSPELIQQDDPAIRFETSAPSILRDRRHHAMKPMLRTMPIGVSTLQEGHEELANMRVRRRQIIDLGVLILCGGED